jgi:hypothetical protein
MKLSNVEALTKFPGCLRSKLFDLQLAHLIGQRLAWPNNVSVMAGEAVIEEIRGLTKDSIWASQSGENRFKRVA